MNHEAVQDVTTAEELKQLLVPELGEQPPLQDILSYAHNVFSHDSWNTPESLDPFTIVDRAQAGEKMRCVEYSILASSLLIAYGTPARLVAGLALSEADPQEFQGHVFIEYWDQDTERWVMHDPQWGITPVSDGKKLSSLELREAFQRGVDVDFVQLDTRRPDASIDDYAAWVESYMDVFDTPGVMPVVRRKTLDEHVTQHRIRLARNADVAARAKGIGPRDIEEVTAEAFYAPAR